MRLLLVLTLMGWPGAAAAEPARKVLLDPGGEAALSRRIRAEANHAGLDVVLLHPRSVRGEDDAVRAFAASADAAALVALASSREVSVYLPSPTGIARDVLRGSVDSDDSLPLRIVEHLRARLTALPATLDEDEPEPAPAPVELASAPTKSDAPPETKGVDPPPTAIARTPEEGADAESAESDATDATGASPPAPAFTDGLWLEGGAGFGSRLDGFESGTRAALGGRYVLAPFSAGVVALIPFSSSEYSEGGSAARARSWSVLVKGAYLVEPARGIGVSAGPGAGIVVQHLDGDAVPPLRTRDDRLVAAALFLHAEASWAVAPWMAFALAVHAGAVTPRVAVRFEGRDVTDTGTWFVDALVIARLRLAVGSVEP